MKRSNNRKVTNMNTREVVIVSACRTIDEGKFKDEMQRENYRIGCASLCVGGGPAMASVWSREAA